MVPSRFKLRPGEAEILPDPALDAPPPAEPLSDMAVVDTMPTVHDQLLESYAEDAAVREKNRAMANDIRVTDALPTVHDQIRDSYAEDDAAFEADRQKDLSADPAVDTLETAKYLPPLASDAPSPQAVPKGPSQADADMAELERAQKMANINKLVQGLIIGSDRARAIRMSGFEKPGPGFDPSMYHGLTHADDGVTQLAERQGLRRKYEGTDTAAQTAAAQQDPNSRDSQVYRKLVSDQYGVPLPSDMSAAQVVQSGILSDLQGLSKVQAQAEIQQRLQNMRSATAIDVANIRKDAYLQGKAMKRGGGGGGGGSDLVSGLTPEMIDGMNVSDVQKQLLKNAIANPNSKLSQALLKSIPPLDTREGNRQLAEQNKGDLATLPDSIKAAESLLASRGPDGNIPGLGDSLVEGAAMDGGVTGKLAKRSLSDGAVKNQQLFGMLANEYRLKNYGASFSEGEKNQFDALVGGGMGGDPRVREAFINRMLQVMKANLAAHQPKKPPATPSAEQPTSSVPSSLKVRVNGQVVTLTDPNKIAAALKKAGR